MKNTTQFQKWDAHHHLWSYQPEWMDWIPSPRIRRDFHLPEWETTLNQAGIDRSIVVQVQQTWQETLDLQAMADQSERIAGVVGWIDLMDEHMPKYWEVLPDHHRVVGFRHILQAESAEWITHPDVLRGIRTLGQHEFAYDVLITQSQLRSAVTLAGSCENTRLIVDHLAKPRFGQVDRSVWEKPMKELAQMPHVAIKLSGFTTECPDFHWQSVDFVPYFDFLLQHFGPNRIMLGSDWPVCLMAASYEEQKGIVDQWMEPLSWVEKESLGCLTAKKWYGL